MDEAKEARGLGGTALAHALAGAAVAACGAIPIGGGVPLFAALLFSFSGAIACAILLVFCVAQALRQGISAWRDWRGKAAVCVAACTVIAVYAAVRGWR